MINQAKPHVLLLRDVPEERRFSMERYADELEHALSRQSEFRVSSKTFHESGIAARLGFRRIDSYLLRFLRYPLAVARLEADIYHIVDQGYAHLAALIPVERTVISCHDVMLLRAEEGGAGQRGRRISVLRFRWSTSYLKKAARVICVSHATAADVMRLCGVSEGRISVVPNGVEPRFRWLGEQEAERLQSTIPHVGRYAILHVSTGTPYKNVATTLRVVAALKDRGVEATLVRVGVPLNSRERALAEELRLGELVVECGRVSDERLVELYNACDALIFPSHYEGFGWPPLEAMACGTPVVASNCPALVEVVGDAGILLPPDDVAGLAHALGSVLESTELLGRLRERGFERARQFTWDRTTAGVAQVYEIVTEEMGHAPKRTEPEAACAG